MTVWPKQWALVALVSFTSLLETSAVLGNDKPAATFAGTNTLLRPQDYREWIFVGSSMGLRYNSDPEKAPRPTAEKFNNVYLSPAAYREYSKTGKFPDGTVLILEVFSAETKREPGLQGSYQKELVALEAAVKDSKRFQEGWAYFSFDDKSGKLKDEAQPFPKASCYACHHEKAADDHVFTQFYPVLKAISKK
jgi:hypothetical protein